MEGDSTEAAGTDVQEDERAIHERFMREALAMVCPSRLSADIIRHLHMTK